MTKKNPIKTSSIPTHKMGFIKRAPVEDIYWQPTTSEELAEGLATIMSSVPNEAIKYVWDNLTSKSDKKSLQEHFNFLWSFYPDGNLPEDRHNQDTMPAHKRDVRYNIYKRPDIGLLLGADRMLPDWQSDWVPKDSKELTLLAYSYGLDVPISHVATTWDRAQRLVGDALINPDFAYTPDPSGRYPDDTDGNLGHPMLPNNKTGDHTTWRNMKESHKVIGESCYKNMSNLDALCESIESSKSKIQLTESSTEFDKETVDEIEKVGAKEFIKKHFPKMEVIDINIEVIKQVGDTVYAPAGRDADKLTTAERSKLGLEDEKGEGDPKTTVEIADELGVSKQAISQIVKSGTFFAAVLQNEDITDPETLVKILEGDDSVKSEIEADLYAIINKTVDFDEAISDDAIVMAEDFVIKELSEIAVREFISRHITSAYLVAAIKTTIEIAEEYGYPKDALMNKNSGVVHKFTKSKSFLAGSKETYSVLIGMADAKGLYDQGNIIKFLIQIDDTGDTPEEKTTRAENATRDILEELSELTTEDAIVAKVGEINPLEIYNSLAPLARRSLMMGNMPIKYFNESIDEYNQLLETTTIYYDIPTRQVFAAINTILKSLNAIANQSVNFETLGMS